jgi:hypothetical protein
MSIVYTLERHISNVRIVNDVPEKSYGFKIQLQQSEHVISIKRCGYCQFCFNFKMCGVV